MGNVRIDSVSLKKIRQITHSDCVGIAKEIREHNDSFIRWMDITGNTNDRYEKIALRSGKGIAGIIYKTGRPWVVENVSDEIPPAERHQYPILMSENMKSFIAVPVTENNTIEGVIIIGYREPYQVSRTSTVDYIKDIQTVCRCELGGIHL